MVNARYSPQLAEHRRFVVELARIIGRGRVDPDDVAQDVMERWVRVASRGSPLNPRAWMTVVVRRLVIDRLRRRRASREVSVDWALVPAVEREPRPWWEALDAAEVGRELASLPAVLRETFALYEFEGRSYRQIARQLDVPKNTVGVRLIRARRRLKRRLAERWAPCADDRP